jgi:1-acyl-sn-glycerol-3-phosphate acyltransferase
MKNIYRTIIASIKFVLFWIAAFAQMPIVALIPKGRLSVAYSRVFYGILMKITGVHVCVRGKLDTKRPLLLVSNHISVFEFAVFPMALGASFFGKAEIEKYPVVGWFAKKFGVVFISRDPRSAMETTKKINDAMKGARYPMTIFPEGTTNNACFVYPFKSSMFDIVNQVPNLTLQPIAMVYHPCNNAEYDDRWAADNLSCPANEKIEKYNADFGKSELVPTKERSTFGHVFHIMKMGGLMVEINLLPPPDLSGMDRKEIATSLHKIISDKFMEIKGK